MDEVGTVECLYCKKPVLAQEALPIQFENEDGSTYIAVFHQPPEECAAIWSLEKLTSIGTRLADALKILADSLKELRKNEQL